MGYLTNIFKNISLPKVSLNEIIKTSNMASAYANDNHARINKLLKRGKYYYKSVKFKENQNYSLLHQSVCDSNLQVVDLILKQSYGKDKDIVEDIDNEIGFAPVHLACVRDDVEMIKDLIEKGNSGIQIKTTNDNLNLMHIAAQFGSLKTLEYLHKNHFSSSIDSLNEEKWSPLHFACFMNKLDISSYLIEHNANLYLRNKQFLTPIEVSILTDNFELFYALFNFHYEIKKLNQYDHPESAKLIHVAASCKKGSRILDFLLEDPNNLHEICNNSLKSTPLHFACMQDNLIAVRSILRKCPNVNMSDYMGNTPLHYAVERGNLQILRLLHEAEADALKKNDEGLSPIQIAVHQDNKEVKLFFLGKGKYKMLNLKEYF